MVAGCPAVLLDGTFHQGVRCHSLQLQCRMSHDEARWSQHLGVGDTLAHLAFAAARNKVTHGVLVPVLAFCTAPFVPRRAILSLNIVLYCFSRME